MSPREQAIHLFNRAMPLIQSDPPMAYRMLASAVEADPGFAQGWALLGASNADLGGLRASVACYRTALRCPDGEQPGDMTSVLRHRCLLQLGHRLGNNWIITDARIEEAETVLRQALALGDVLLTGDTLTGHAELSSVLSSQAFCHTNLSLLASHRGDSETELVEAERGFALSPEPMTEMGLAFALLFNGEYRRGLEYFESRFPYKLNTYMNYPWPRWTGESVERLFVACEMGLGDSLSFARFIGPAAARVGELVFSVQPELVGLLAAALENVGNVRVMPQNHVLGDFDAWTPAFSLPVPLGFSTARIRDCHWNLTARPVEDVSWKRKGARLHVAIAWAGAAGNDIDMHRSIPFVEFLALRDVPGIALYSIQVGERCRDLHDSGGVSLVRDLAPWIRDSRDTAGILGEMDSVVACESFVAHLAGALNKPCHVLCSRFGRDWRTSPYLGNRALWYPNTKVVRQTIAGSWTEPFQEVVRCLT